MNSHLKTRPSDSLKRRKTPRQSRSTCTVEAIFDACIQVLLDGGMDRLTTTRVAARAGVSIGSLYQYFANKQSLLAAVLERHLLRVIEAVEHACLACKNCDTDHMAATLVDAFVTAKLQDAAASRALYAIAAEVDGMQVVTRQTERAHVAVCSMLATAVDRQFTELPLIGFVLTSALVGPVQALLAANAPSQQVVAVRLQLKAMVSAYLRAAASPTTSAASRRGARSH